MKKNVFIGFVSLFLLCHTSCSDTPEHIAFLSSPKYKARVKKLKIKPPEAWKIFRAYFIKERNIEVSKEGSQPVAFLWQHVVLYDHYYVFTFRDKFELKLSGYYLDGYTGKIEKRESKERYPLSSVFKYNKGKNWISPTSGSNERVKMIME